MTREFLNYLQYEKRYSRHTLICYKTDLDQLDHFLEDCTIPARTFRESNHAMLRDWIISLSSDGLDARSINRKVAAVRSYFTFLQKKGRRSSQSCIEALKSKNEEGIATFCA
jgi:integrase/recombinase XerC